ncbi:MAG: hypothetical protein BWY75_00477 [bacterium ADurb.Bin425]|nr:MAG: hypothetical protein BWY75_00477 [bacterium ADurb.Bin425]
MSKGVDITAVEQGNPRCAESGRQSEAVRTVAVQMQGIAVVQLDALLVDQRDGHEGAVGSRCEEALALVVGRLIARHFLHLDRGHAARAHVVVEHRWRCHQRLVAEAQGGAVVFQIASRTHGVDRLGELHVVADIEVVQVDDLNTHNACVFAESNQMSLEEKEAGEQHAGLVRYHFLPVLTSRLAHRRLEEAEVGGSFIGANIEVLAVIVDIVLDAGKARHQGLELTERLVGRQSGDIAGGVALALQVDVSTAARTSHADPEELVLLFLDENVALGAELVPVDLVGTLGDGVLGGVEESLVIGGPSHRSDALSQNRRGLTGAQVLHHQLVLAEAGVVVSVSQEVLAGAEAGRTDLEEGLAFGQFVVVEQDLLGTFFMAALLAIGKQGLAAGNRILLAGFGAAVVEEAAATVGYRGVGFFHTPAHFGKERRLQVVRVAHVGIGVGVFGTQMRHEVGVVPIAHPGIFVDQGVAVQQGRHCKLLGARGPGVRLLGISRHNQFLSKFVFSEGEVPSKRKLEWDLPKCQLLFVGS